MLVAALVDAYVDRLFAADGEAEDILVFRAAAASASPALAQIMALCSRQVGTALVMESIAVPIANYGTLAVEDFMVSLYNGHTVQRLRLVTSTGASFDMHEVLAEAIAGLGAG